MKTLYSFLLSFCTTSIVAQFALDPHIKIDQVGYRPTDRKIAVVSDPQIGFNSPDPYTPGTTLQVRDVATNTIQFTGNCNAWNGGATHTQSGDKLWWFDFSAFTSTGDFYILDPSTNKRSYTFHISTDVYNDALRYALRTYYFQRCGMAKQMPYSQSANYTDVICHHGALQDLDCRDVTNPISATSRDLSGGWHDAGDYNKYVNFTLAALHYLLDAYEQNPTAFDDANNIPESGNGTADILDEAKWELDWLMKMQLTNGSVLMKVSTAGFTGGSPPSTETNQRYYGAAQSSATRTVASVFAHAAIVFRTQSNAIMQVYGDSLLARAELAWYWLQNNPGYSNYANTGFSSANPEVSHYDQDATSFSAAVYLYAATGNVTYKVYVDNNYSSLQPIQWTYWYPFESVYQNAMLYYTATAGATTATVNAIRANCISSVNTNNADLLTAYYAQTDGYMAYLKDQDYQFNSDQYKAETGSIYGNMLRYNLSPGNATSYTNASQGYIHFFHGVNAFGNCFLTNATAFGGDQFTMQIYHGWFGDGTIFDSTAGYIGPPPGYVPCGIDYYYTPDAAYTGPPIAPPMNQPVQKSYKDWNTSWPENSWQCSEVGIYTEAAYIKLLSTYCSAPVAMGIYTFSDNHGWQIYPNPATESIHIICEGGRVPVVRIYDANGKLVKEELTTDLSYIPVKNLAPGIYTVTVTFGEDDLSSCKLMIVR